MGFYGGKPGISINLAKSFESVAEMVEAFALGNDYTEVSYGEFVLINTPSNRSLENGCLYRRDTDYDRVAPDPSIEDPGHGAIYVGYIRGPKGEATIEFEDWDTFKTNFQDATIATGPMGIFEHGIDSPAGGPEPAQDTIDFGYYQKQDPNTGNLLSSVLGISAPHLTLKITASNAIGAYDKNTGIFGPAINNSYTSMAQNIYTTVSAVSITNAATMYSTMYSALVAESIPTVTANFIAGVFRDRYLDTPFIVTLQDIEDGLASALPYTKDLTVDYYKIGSQYYRWDSVLNAYLPEIDIWQADEATDREYIYSNLVRENDESRGRNFFKSLDLVLPPPISVKKIEVEDITNDLKIKYTDGSEETAGNVNGILDMTLQGDNLIILFSNKERRNVIPSNLRATEDYNGNTYNDWLNLGPILKGNHVFGTFEDLTNASGTGLKDLFPYGFGKTQTGAIHNPTKEFMGWIAEVGTKTTGFKAYAFDYNANPQDWVELNVTLNEENFCIVAIDDGTGNPAGTTGNTYAVNGTLWFVVEN